MLILQSTISVDSGKYQIRIITDAYYAWRTSGNRQPSTYAPFYVLVSEHSIWVCRPSKELNRREVSRIAGLSEHMFHLSIQQRQMMLELAKHYPTLNSFCQLISAAEEIGIEVPPQSIAHLWLQKQKVLFFCCCVVVLLYSGLLLTKFVLSTCCDSWSPHSSNYWYWVKLSMRLLCCCQCYISN